MKKVESQAEQGLADRRASPIGWFYWQLVFARLQHPVAVTALIISICAALFLGVTKYSRRELHQSVVVSFPANETLRETESTIELLRAGSLELGSKTDTSRVEKLNALIRQKLRDKIKPNGEQLPPGVRARLTDTLFVYNDSLAQWKKTNRGPEAPQTYMGQISPITTDDSEKVVEIYKAVEEDNPANAEVLKNASIVGIEPNKVEWITVTTPQPSNEASFWQSAKRTKTTLRIRDQQGSYDKEFTPGKTESTPDLK